MATGSRPLLPGLPGLEGADPLTTDSVWGLGALPERLIVLGRGWKGTIGQLADIVHP